MDLSDLYRHFERAQQRGLLWLQGDKDWSVQWLMQQLKLFESTYFERLPLNRKTESVEKTANQNKPKNSAEFQIFCHSNDINAETLSLNFGEFWREKKFQKLLGREANLLIYDAFSGFSPDSFGALAGTLAQGGLLILMTPTPNEWTALSDPETTKYTVENYTVSDSKNGFIPRVVEILSQTEHVVSISPQNENISSYLQAFDSRLTSISATPEIHQEQIAFGAANQSQVDVIAKISLELLENKPSTTVLTADRGRGKSAALGIVAAQLLRSAFDRNQPFKIVVSSLNKTSVETLFYWLQKRLTALEITFEDINLHCLTFLENRDSWVKFIAPDELMLNLPEADVVLIDEAAATPSQMLLPVIEHYSRLVFATTVHGYEGTGRGFEYKLKPALQKQFVNYQELHLSAPIRWAVNDQLEPLVNRMLALDLDLPEIAKVATDDVQECLGTLQFSEILPNSMHTENVFSLLINAHYRTSPSDFRAVLDAPNLRLFTLFYQGIPIAGALVAKEGELEEELCEQIWQCRRRPRGHLFPQSLMSHGGFKEAGAYSYLRVVRIAVHPELQNKTLGTLLLTQIEKWAKQQGFDFLCSSFGLTESLFRFWQRAKFQLLRVGVKPEASTGERSAMVLKSLSIKHESMLDEWYQRNLQQLILQTRLLNLNTSPSVETLIQEVQLETKLSKQDMADVLVFARHHRTLDTCLLALFRFLKHHQSDSGLLFEKIMMGRPNSELIQAYGLSGEREFVSHLRLEANALLSAVTL